MSILTANLKHLYQRRSFWLLGAFFGLTAFLIISFAVNRKGVDKFSAPMIWIPYFSIFIAALSLEVLTRPFSYCLPGHFQIPRKFLFCVGLSISFLWSFLFLLFPGLSLGQTILVCISAFAAFSTCCWLGTWVVFRFNNWASFLALFPLFILSCQLFDTGTTIVHIIVHGPVPVILLGALVNYLAWIYLGKPDLARRYCGKLWIGAFDAWNKEKMSKLRLARLAQKIQKNPNFMTISPKVEQFFISRISKSEIASVKRYVWGDFYKIFGMTLSQYKQSCISFTLLIIPIIFLLCYFPGGGKNIIFIMPGLMVIHLGFGVHSGLLIHGGREQRFWSTLISVLITGLSVTAVVILLAATTQSLKELMPPLTIQGHQFTFSPLNTTFSLATLAMIPLSFSVSLAFYKKPMLMMILVIMIFQIFFTLVILNSLTVNNSPIRVTPLHMVVTMICAWTIFVSVLRFISMRCCLVKQTK